MPQTIDISNPYGGTGGAMASALSDIMDKHQKEQDAQDIEAAKQFAAQYGNRPDVQSLARQFAQANPRAARYLGGLLGPAVAPSQEQQTEAMRQRAQQARIAAYVNGPGGGQGAPGGPAQGGASGAPPLETDPAAYQLITGAALPGAYDKNGADALYLNRPDLSPELAAGIRVGRGLDPSADTKLTTGEKLFEYKDMAPYNKQHITAQTQTEGAHQRELGASTVEHYAGADEKKALTRKALQENSIAAQNAGLEGGQFDPAHPMAKPPQAALPPLVQKIVSDVTNYRRPMNTISKDMQNIVRNALPDGFIPPETPGDLTTKIAADKSMDAMDQNAQRLLAAGKKVLGDWKKRMEVTYLLQEQDKSGPISGAVGALARGTLHNIDPDVANYVNELNNFRENGLSTKQLIAKLPMRSKAQMDVQTAPMPDDTIGSYDDLQSRVGSWYPLAETVRAKQRGGAPNQSKFVPPPPGGSGGDSGPKVGDTKRFPNGAVGVWDGHGWAAQGGN